LDGGGQSWPDRLARFEGDGEQNDAGAGDGSFARGDRGGAGRSGLGAHDMGGGEADEKPTEVAEGILELAETLNIEHTCGFFTWRDEVREF
jgi:hypothetical protein